MKRFLAGALAVLMLASLTACGGTDKETDSAPVGSSAAQSAPADSSAAQSAAADSSTAQSAAADPTAYTIDGAIPEAFVETDSGAEGTLLYAADDGSTISIGVFERPADADEPVDEEAMRSMFEQEYAAYAEQEGVEVVMDDFTFEEMTVGPCPAYRIHYSVTIAGARMTQDTMSVLADNQYIITCTTTEGDAWADTFDAMFSTIEAIPLEA